MSKTTAFKAADEHAFKDLKKIPVKGDYIRTTKPAKRYSDPTKAVQSFDGVALFQVVDGNLILRGRNGMRDVFYPLDRAIDNWKHMCILYSNLRKVSPFITSELKEILKDYGHKVVEAYQWREKHNDASLLRKSVLLDSYKGEIQKINAELANDLKSFEN